MVYLMVLAEPVHYTPKVSDSHDVFAPDVRPGSPKIGDLVHHPTS